ncbi:MAG TPA: DHHA1 domain-containing protein [Patescibacteria group bacterium]|nr:DHHA1 domain-containing protein [Patescibacteria group bacterium]
MDTIKLYHEDAYCRNFMATILMVKAVDGTSDCWEVVLDRTAFYPESGGQPWDTGTLNNCPVMAVREKGGQIVHTVNGHPGAGAVRGEIDWERRFDHMQQHSGEHILSGVFLSQWGANNVGFHLGAVSSQIDLDLAGMDEMTAESVEQTANRAVAANHPVTCQLVTEEELSGFTLRKELSKQVAQVRVVDMDGVDCCPCGGTHVAFTGEVGPIKIRGWEKKKGGIRIDFVCGSRAVADYQDKHRSVGRLAVLLSVPPDQVVPAVQRQMEKTETLQRELALLRHQMNQQLAEDLLRQRDSTATFAVITHVVKAPAGGELAELASLLTAKLPVVALLAGVQPDLDKTTLLFAATNGLPVDMNAVLRAATAQIDGKGGGTRWLAQGGGGCPEKIPEILVQTKNLLINGAVSHKPLGR